jgi:hypothetical protein
MVVGTGLQSSHLFFCDLSVLVESRRSVGEAKVRDLLFLAELSTIFDESSGIPNST